MSKNSFHEGPYILGKRNIYNPDELIGHPSIIAKYFPQAFQPQPSMVPGQYSNLPGHPFTPMLSPATNVASPFDPAKDSASLDCMSSLQLGTTITSKKPATTKKRKQKDAGASTDSLSTPVKKVRKTVTPKVLVNCKEEHKPADIALSLASLISDDLTKLAPHPSSYASGMNGVPSLKRSPQINVKVLSTVSNTSSIDLS